jgi:hypothetical protein
MSWDKGSLISLILPLLKTKVLEDSLRGFARSMWDQEVEDDDDEEEASGPLDEASRMRTRHLDHWTKLRTSCRGQTSGPLLHLDLRGDSNFEEEDTRREGCEEDDVSN